ncbi:hypothetical protein V6U90_31715 [Micromonospora sp. CPCC 206060]
MKISKQVEPLVRNAIHAAVKRDFPKLDAALRSFPTTRLPGRRWNSPWV